MKLIKTFDFECYELGVYENKRGHVRLGGCMYPAEEQFSDNMYQWTLGASDRMIEALLSCCTKKTRVIKKIGAGAYPDEMRLERSTMGDGIKIGCAWAVDPRGLRKWLRKHVGMK